MKRNRFKSNSIAFLIVLFLVIVLVGRFYFLPHLPSTANDVYSPPSDVATSSDDTQASNNSSALTSTKIASTSETDQANCEDALHAEVVAKKQSYAKGQILVTFNPAVVYKEVKDVLSVYGLVVQNEIDSKSSFSSRHLVTAAVAPGQEIVKVCQLRSDAHVKYAGLDLYFNLHE